MSEGATLERAPRATPAADLPPTLRRNAPLVPTDTSAGRALAAVIAILTFLAALALFLFGGGILEDISFTFIVGIITSTFSAIFIAAQVFYWWHKGDRKHVEAHADIAPRYEWQGASKASE